MSLLTIAIYFLLMVLDLVCLKILNFCLLLQWLWVVTVATFLACCQGDPDVDFHEKLFESILEGHIVAILFIKPFFRRKNNLGNLLLKKFEK